MKHRLLMLLSAGLLATTGLALAGRLNISTASADTPPSTSCSLTGTASFSPPLGLSNKTTTVKIKADLSGCSSNPYGITGGTIKGSGSGLATCNPSVTDGPLTSNGTIKWVGVPKVKGEKAVSTETSTSTAVPDSSPPSNTLSGEIAGGYPVPAGTATSGSTTYTITSSTQSECIAGKLKKLSFTGTTTTG
jgi:hypothetical protein